MYKAIIRNVILIKLFMIFFTGCASVSISNYQDGKALGKSNIRVGGGIETSPMMNYGLMGADKENPEKFKKNIIFDSDFRTEEIDSTLYFWSLANLILQYGLTDNIDVGLIPFSDFSAIYSLGSITNFGAKAFAKYSLMDEHNEMQIAIVPYYGYGRFRIQDSTSSNLNLEWEPKLIQYNTIYYGLDVPISYQNIYLALKVYFDNVTGNFTYFDKPNIEHTPSLDLRTSYGVALGADTPGSFGRIELQLMFQEVSMDEWLPRVYIGYNKFFTFDGSK